MAEALFNFLPLCKDKFKAFSAGSFPIGGINPLAMELLENNGMATDDLYSKSWKEFAKPNSPQMDFIITVCDLAAGEQCPVWPGKPITAHWSIRDPIVVGGTLEEKRQAFRDAFITLRRRIELFASLPFDKLDDLAVKSHMSEIGAQ